MQPVYSLSLRDPVYVRAYVGEPDLGKSRRAPKVEVATDSSDKRYQGKVGYISPRAEFTPKSVETTDLRTDLVYRLRVVVRRCRRWVTTGNAGDAARADPIARHPDVPAAVEIRDVVKKFGDVEALKGVIDASTRGASPGSSGPTVRARPR